MVLLASILLLVSLMAELKEGRKLCSKCKLKYNLLRSRSLEPYSPIVRDKCLPLVKDNSQGKSVESYRELNVEYKLMLLNVMETHYAQLLDNLVVEDALWSLVFLCLRCLHTNNNVTYSSIALGSNYHLLHTLEQRHPT